MGQISISCPECGAALAPDTPLGQCPACLLRIGLAVVDGGLGFTLDPPGTDPDNAARPGDRTRCRRLGDYELLEEVAHGGMGIVYRARQISLNRIVALKMIRVGDLAEESELARFQAESAAAAQLDHPNIVPVYEVGVHDHRHYFVMKLIEGGALSQRMAAPAGRPAPREAASLVSRVARAVHYAHQRGILHRDLKPGNILLDTRGEPHITDFGLAKHIEGDGDLTLKGAIVGTPHYIAPEQAAGKPLTTGADIYSLGAILYELLAGRPPFHESTVMATLQKVVQAEPVPPSRRAGPERGGAGGHRIERDLETICLKCLAKDPARRYGSAEALAEDLERWLAHQPIRARPVGTVERVLKWTRRKPALAALLVTLCVTITLAAGGVLWQWRRAGEAVRQQREELWRSQSLQARSHRLSLGPGRRGPAMQLIARAAAYRPSLDLRDEALATMVRPDLGSNTWWHTRHSDFEPVRFTGDLEYFAGTADDGILTVWRGADPEPKARFPDGGQRVMAVRFSPDDSLLAAKSTDGTLRVWRWRTAEPVLQARTWEDDSAVPSFDFSPDGREFWFSDARERVAVHSLPDGRAMPSSALAVRARRLQWDPTGRRLAAWSGGSLTVWDRATGARLGAWEAPASIWCVAWHPSGDRLAVGAYEAGVHVAELGREELEPLNPGPDAHAVFTRLAFTRDGDFVLAGGWGNLCVMWNLATRQQELRSHTDWFLQVSRDGSRVAVALERKGLGVRSLELPIGIRRLRVPAAQLGDASDVAWHPGGRWLLTGHRSGWTIWDTLTGEPVRQHHDTVVIRSVGFVPDGSAFVTGGEGGPQLWPLRESGGPPDVGPPRLLTLSSPRPNERVVLSPDGRRFAAVGEESWLGSVAGDRPPVRIEDAKWNTFVRYSPDGRWLCLLQWKDSKLRIRDGFTGAVVTNLDFGPSSYFFSPDGSRLFSVGWNRLTAWEPGTWKRLQDLPFGDDRTYSDVLGLWPEGNCVVTFNHERMLQFRDPASNTAVATLWLPTESAGNAVFDSTGQHLAITGGRPWVDVWDVAALRRELARLGLDWPGGHPSAQFASRAGR